MARPWKSSGTTLEQGFAQRKRLKPFLPALKVTHRGAGYCRLASRRLGWFPRSHSTEAQASGFLCHARLFASLRLGFSNDYRTQVACYNLHVQYVAADILVHDITQLNPRMLLR